MVTTSGVRTGGANASVQCTTSKPENADREPVNEVLFHSSYNAA